jgi:hypothetical protein
VHVVGVKIRHPEKTLMLQLWEVGQVTVKRNRDEVTAMEVALAHARTQKNPVSSISAGFPLTCSRNVLSSLSYGICDFRINFGDLTLRSQF